jgi:tetratricopeptide (TPR) repeat protein
MDPEDLSEVIRDYQRAATAAIESFGGMVARFLGDGILAYFGYPTAHEDDASRAVLAGLTLIDRVGRISASQSLHVRVGIATGRVVVGERIGEGASEELEVMGTTPNLAARLQALAQPDQVVVSPRTKRLLPSNFECEDLGQHRVKGFDDPVRVHHVRSSAGRPDKNDEERLTQLFGRELEISLLQDRWRRARAGRVQSVLVVAEGGLGKSRLVRGFLDQALEGEARSVSLHGSPYHRQSAFHPLRVELGHVLAEAGSLSLALEDRGLSAVASEVGPPLARMLDLEPDPSWPEFAQDGREPVHQALLRWYRAPGNGPVVWVAEDLQWADPSTLEFLDHVLEHGAQCPWLVVGTARPEGAKVWSGHQNLTTLSLARLDADEAERMAAEMGVSDSGVRRSIVQRADGVPLFVEELAKAARAGLDVTVPETLEDSLMARLDALGEAKRTAQLAAVIGRTFTGAHLDELAGGDRGGSLRVLVDSGVVLHRESQGCYEFKHALIRDAAYRSLLNRTRRDAHRRLADLLADDPSVEPEEVAQHFAAAEVSEQASRWFGKAGAHAATRSANLEAAEHFRSAIAHHGDAEDEPRLVYLMGCAEALRALDQYEGALGDFCAAAALAEKLGDPGARARALNGRGGSLFSLGRPDECRDAYGLAAEAARRAGDRGEEVRARAGIADGDFMEGRMRDAAVQIRQVIDIAREQPDLERALSVGYCTLGVLEVFDLRAARTVELAADAHAIATRRGDLRTEMLSVGPVGALARLCLGDLEGALAGARESETLALKFGAEAWAAAMQWTAGCCRLRAGEDALDELRAASDRIKKHSVVMWGPAAAGGLALAERGAERRAALDWGWSLLDGPTVGHAVLWFLALGTEAAWAEGDAAELARFARLADDLERDTGALAWLTLYGELARGLRALIDAEDHRGVTRALELATDAGYITPDHLATRALNGERGWTGAHDPATAD